MKRIIVLLALLLLCLTACAPAEEIATADAPVPGQDPFGNTYYYRAAVKFDNYIGGANDYREYLTMTFAFTEDGRFLMDGTDMGDLKETVLTEENFDSLLVPRENEGYYVTLAKKLREENRRAWTVGGDFILLLQSSGALFLLDRHTIFDVEEKPVRVLRLGTEPLTASGKNRWYGVEGAKAVETSTVLTDGSAYITAECVYHEREARRTWADSNYYYWVDGNDFVSMLRWRQEERGRSTLSRDWQPVSWEDRVWRRDPSLTEAMEEIAPPESWRCIPLEYQNYLLTAEEQLFLLEGDGLYRLEQMDSIAAAKWAYLERLNRDHLPLELVFEGEYEVFQEVWLDCTQGELFGVMLNRYTGQRYQFSGEADLMYWSPMNEDGSRSKEVVIEFALLKGDMFTRDEDDIFLRGTITADLNGTQYQNVRIETDGDLPEGISISVLDWEGNTLCKTAG